MLYSIQRPLEEGRWLFVYDSYVVDANLFQQGGNNTMNEASRLTHAREGRWVSRPRNVSNRIVIHILQPAYCR